MLNPALMTTLGLLMELGKAAPAPQPDRGSQEPSAPLVAQRQFFPLNCRGGAGLAFDTLGPPSEPGKVRLSLTFTAAPAAAGAEGQGLEPGTCAWADRPIHGEEPRQLRVTIGADDSTPRLSVRDPGVYWSFLARNSDSGHFTGVGYRHWHGSSPPPARDLQAPARTPTRGGWLPFNVPLLPLFVIGLPLIAGPLFMIATAAWSGWRRLARSYPGQDRGPGRSFRARPILMGLTNYRGGAHLTPDDSFLHFSMGPLGRLGHPPFSVPWSDITASRDEWPWFPFKGHPVIRLTIAKHQSLRLLIPMTAGEKILAVSEGRVQSESGGLAAAVD